MPILLSANRNLYRAFQFQESLVWDHKPRYLVWNSKHDKDWNEGKKGGKQKHVPFCKGDCTELNWFCILTQPWLCSLSSLTNERSSVGRAQAPHRLTSRWYRSSIHSSNGLGCSGQIHVRRDICDTYKYDDDTYTATVDTIQVRYHTQTAVFTCCACFAENMMMMYQQFPLTRYVSSYGLGFSFSLFSGGLFF